jgi:succinoglycan biosynthesis protein ExoM
MADRADQRVCVAIPTYRRPAALAALLHNVALQVVPPGTRAEVLVIDNDRQPTAGAVVAAARADFPFALDYVHQPEPGLCVVRNTALAHARDGYDFLAMIDDDEIPQVQWLSELLRVQRATGADVVIGPVPQEVPAAAPAWIRAGRFFELPAYADGAAIEQGYSGNCLLDVRSLERFGVVFDPSLNFAGGEDTLFFRELGARGAKMVFAAHAVAVEAVPAGRLRASYIVKLNYRRGNTRSICDRRLDPSTPVLARRAVKALGRLALGMTTLLPLAALRGRTGALIALCNMAQGLGGLAGLGGHVYHAYSRHNTASL